MATKDIIAAGIGFSPGSVKYIVTRGLSIGVSIPVAVEETLSGGWWIRPKQHETIVAPKRVRRIIRQAVQGATEKDLELLRQQARNAVAAKHAWSEAYNDLIDRAIAELAKGAAAAAPAAETMMLERVAAERRRNDEDAFTVMIMALF